MLESSEHLYEALVVFRPAFEELDSGIAEILELHVMPLCHFIISLHQSTDQKNRIDLTFLKCSMIEGRSLGCLVRWKGR